MVSVRIFLIKIKSLLVSIFKKVGIYGEMKLELLHNPITQR